MSEKIDRLQILRAFAALLVVADHAIPYILPRIAHPQEAALLCAEFGNYGVSIFFVISGFIMVHTSGSLFGRPGGAWQFARRRAARIAPLYWIFSAVALLIALSSGEKTTPGAILSSLLFIAVPNEDGGPIRPLVGQGWTLDYEMGFYAVFAACLLLDRRWGSRIFIAAMVAPVLIGCFAVPPMAAGLAATMTQFYTDPQLLQFVAGVGLGMFFSDAPASRMRRPQIGPAAAFLACLLLVGAGFAIHDSGLVAPSGLAYRGVATVIATLCVLLCLAGQNDPASRLRRSLVAMGEASYSLYLAHGFGIIAVAIWLPPLDPSVPVWLFLLAAGAAAIAVGFLVHHLVERPIAKALRSRKRRVPIPDASVLAHRA